MRAFIHSEDEEHSQDLGVKLRFPREIFLVTNQGQGESGKGPSTVETDSVLMSGAFIRRK